jgi:hypothetical protein
LETAPPSTVRHQSAAGKVSLQADAPPGPEASGTVDANAGTSLTIDTGGSAITNNGTFDAAGYAAGGSGGCKRGAMLVFGKRSGVSFGAIGNHSKAEGQACG